MWSYGCKNSFSPSCLPALRESPNPRSVYFLILSSHRFFCLPLLHAPFTVPNRIYSDMPEDFETWPYHLSFCIFTSAKRLPCILIASCILLGTSSFITEVFVGDIQKPLMASHIETLDHSFKLCCNGPALKSIRPNKNTCMCVSGYMEY